MSSKIPKVLFILLVLATIVVPARAQENHGTAWLVDTQHSFSRLSIGASSDSASAVAVAQVSGAVRIDPSPSPTSIIVFDVSPAGDAQYPAANYPRFSFRSRDIRVKPDGTIEAAGELTLTYLEPSVTLDPNEAYSGPVDAEFVVRMITRPVTFVLDATAANLESGAVELDASASTVISSEDFPGVRDLVLHTNWPPVTVDENCQAPPDADEAYPGVVCTGSALSAPLSHDVPSTVSAEDEPILDTVTAPEGSQILITLNLHLSKETYNAQSRPAD